MWTEEDDEATKLTPLLDWLIPVYQDAGVPFHQGHLLRWAFIRRIAEKDSA